MPVHRLPEPGPKPPVFAIRSELDRWVESNIPFPHRQAIRARQHPTLGVQPLSETLLERINILGNLTLYRRDYHLSLVLRKTRNGVHGTVGCSYKLFNATDDRQSFVQEVTVDVPDHGYVEELSFLADDKPVYILKKPEAAEQHPGYASYRGKDVIIEPAFIGVSYECRASWVINRGEDDFWSMHMLLPTIGISVETQAPPDFIITRSFSIPNLVMKAEHIDLAWRHRERRL